MPACWHCGGQAELCDCITCADERGSGICYVCTKARWNHPTQEKANAGQHNAVMRRRFRDYIGRMEIL